MLNFNVPSQVQRERLSICKKCKFYNSTFGTCGTPIVGNNIKAEENDVTYYKEKIKLCGCFMDIKTKFRFASCPARKWFAQDMEQNEIAELDAFIKRISKANRVTNEDLKILYYWYGKITKKHQRPSGCASCVRDLINEFYRQLSKIDKP
jgi:hypothetical protein